MNVYFISIVVFLLNFNYLIANDQGYERYLKYSISSKFSPKIEPDGFNDVHHDPAPPYSYNSRHNFETSFVDYSPNGYGMVSSSTNPLSISNNGERYIAYRKYIDGMSSGIMASAFSPDGESWASEILNYDMLAARYPSSLIGNQDSVYMFWNEYTAVNTDNAYYGGKPYYSYGKDMAY